MQPLSQLVDLPARPIPLAPLLPGTHRQILAFLQPVPASALWKALRRDGILTISTDFHIVVSRVFTKALVKHYNVG